MKNTIPIAIVAAGVILAGALYVTNRPDTSNASMAAVAARPLDTTDHVLGSPAAPVTLIEYSDFDCPHCATFNATLRQIIADYGGSGKVSWAFRNFALTEIHPNARRHAEAAECVAKVAGSVPYFAFADSLFQNQPIDPSRYAELAQKVGASADKVSQCIQNAATNGIDARIDADRQNALDAGAQGTPYTVLLVKGAEPVVIDGAMPYADLKDKIAQALANVK